MFYCGGIATSMKNSTYTTHKKQILFKTNVFDISLYIIFIFKKSTIKIYRYNIESVMGGGASKEEKKVSAGRSVTVGAPGLALGVRAKSAMQIKPAGDQSKCLTYDANAGLSVLDCKTVPEHQWNLHAIGAIQKATSATPSELATPNGENAVPAKNPPTPPSTPTAPEKFGVVRYGYGGLRRINAWTIMYWILVLYVLCLVFLKR